MKRFVALCLVLFLAAAVVTAFAVGMLRRSKAQVSVFFTDQVRLAVGTPPFEVPVPRTVSAKADLPAAVLAEFFKGPNPEEARRGLVAITSGFTGFSRLVIQDDIARVYLTGPCRSGGATYTVAQPIIRNLTQFEEILYVKIFDAEGNTEEPEGPSNSIPPCLEP